MTLPSSDSLLVGLVALALMPIIGWRIWRGLRDGRLPVYRMQLSQADQPGRFKMLLALHSLSLLAVAAISADLLLGLDLRSRL